MMTYAKMPFLKTQRLTLALLCGLFLLAATAVQAQYKEEFSTAGRGYLTNFVDNFSGVNWTLSSPWVQNPDPPGGIFGRDITDYFQTSGGVLSGIDFDQNLCWTSPVITVPMSGVTFSLNLAWTDFNRDAAGPPATASDYIDVEFSTDGGSNWTRIPNTVGGGVSGHTISYINSGPTNQSGNTTITRSSISGGGTLIIRVCGQVNDPAESITIDNVDVPLGSVGGCTAPTLSTSVSNVSCNGGSTGKIDLTVSGGGTSPYTYSWTGGAATEDLMNLAVGTYTVTVTDALLCSATTTATIGVAPAITRSTVVGDATCAAVADGGVDLTVSGGVPPYTYSWTGGAMTQDIDNVTPGTYTVTITDAPGCAVTTSATVGVVAAGPYNETFATAGKGYLPNFEDNFVGVSWSIDPWTVTDIPNNIIGREADDYYRTSGGALVGVDLDRNVCWVSPVIDINPPGSGVSFTVDFAWTKLARENVSNVASDYIDVEYSVDGGAWTRVPTTSPATGLSLHTICYQNSGPTDNNGSLVLTVPGLSGSTLRIRVCSEFNSEDESISINSVSVSAGSGVYCPAPESNAGNDEMVCGATGVTLAATATNGTGAWSVVSGPSTSNTQFSSTSAANAVFTPSGGAGTYTLRWTVSANGFADATDDVVITVKAKPSATITPNPSPVCQNATLNLSVPDAGVGASYNWSGSGIVNTNANSTTAVPSATGSQPYAVTVTGANACSTVGSINVTVNAQPSATITIGGLACEGVILDLSVPDAGVGASYTWSGPGVVSSNTAATTAMPPGTGLQTYMVTVTTANNCSNTSSNAVTVYAIPSATITPNPNPVCQNAILNLSVPDAGVGASYNWSGNGLTNSNNRNVNATPNTTGSQTYSVTVTANGCSNTGSVSVTVNPAPDVSSIAGAGTYCGGALVNLTAPAGGTTYSWQKSLFGNSFANIGSGNPFNPTSSGFYRAVVTNSFNCTATSAPVVVNMADHQFTGSLGAGDAQQTGRLNRFAVVSTCAAPKSCPSTFSTSGARFYDSYTLTNNSGSSACVTIGYNSGCGTNAFVVAYSSSFNPASLCTNYLGDPGSSPVTSIFYEVTVPANGTIVVVVHEVNTGAGCGSYTLTVDIPSIALTASPNPVCVGSTLNLSATSIPGANYSWSGNGVVNANSNTTTAVPLVSGSQTYTVSVSNAIGCPVNATATVTVEPPLTAVITPNPSPVCVNGTLNLSVPDAGVGATYTWSGNGVVNANSNTTTAVPNATGSQAYAVTVTAPGSCSATGTVNVTVNPRPSATITPNPNPVCQNSTLNLSVPSAGGGATYNWSGNGVVNANSNTTTAVPTATGSQPYAVTVTNANGCSATSSTNVTVNAQPSATITPSPNPVCQNSTLNLSVPSAGGGATYNWSGNGVVNANANTTTAVPTATGSQAYAVTVTNANGCTNTSSVNVTVNPQPSATITPNPSPVCQNSTLNLSVPNAGGGASYNWSGNGVVNTNSNATTAVPTATGSQPYAVTVTNASGCTNTGSVNVTVNPQPSATITATQSSVCGPALVNLSVPSAGGGASYNWSGNGVVNNNSNATTASPNSGGNQTYQVTVTNAQGCSNTSSTTILINICIAGRIIWKTDNTSGVKDVTVTLSGDQSASVLTPLNGTYSFNFNSGSSFMITPSKNLNKMNGVNAQDVFRLQQHLSGGLLTDPYLLAAADVSANNIISALDVNIIQLALLGNPQALAQFLYSWRFVPTAHTMTNPPWGYPEKITIANAGSGLANQDFYGIKVGDVTAIYANPANSSGTPVVFRVQDQFLKAGQTVSVDFTADQLADLTAFQLALRFDPNQLHLSDIQSLTALPLSEDNFGVQEDGLIRVLWAGTDAVALRAPSPVFRLTFTALQSGGKLSDVLGLDNSVLPAHVYNSKDAESDLSLRFFEVTGTNDPTLTQDRLVLYQNQPNPFEHETLIGFYLPEAAKTAFTVYDVNGRLVYRQDINGNKGYNQLTLKDQTLPNAGLFYYRVETATASATRKMVKVE